MQGTSKHLIDAVPGSQSVREWRWAAGIACPWCQSTPVIKRGFEDTEPARPRSECLACHQRCDELTDPMFAGHPQPLKGWGWCRYGMGLHLAKEHMAHA